MKAQSRYVHLQYLCNFSVHNGVVIGQILIEILYNSECTQLLNMVLNMSHIEGRQVQKYQPLGPITYVHIHTHISNP